MSSNIYYMEVNTILSQLNNEELSKIPNDIIEIIRKKANNKQLNISNTRALEKQISREALSLLTYILLKYVVDEEQKIKVKDSLVQNQIQYDKQHGNVKDIDEIFKSKEMPKELCVIEKESLIKKIINKIIGFFGNKNKNF